MNATVNKTLSLTPEVATRLGDIDNASAYVDNLVRADLGMPARPVVSERPSLRKVTPAEVRDAVVKHGSATATAEALGVAVSTITRAMKKGATT